MRPPRNVPTKIMPIATSKGIAACTLVRWSIEFGDWKAELNTLHA